MENALSEIGEVKSLVKDLIRKVEDISSLQNEITILKGQIDDLKEDLVTVKKRNNLVAWILPTISAAITAVFVLLLTAYINSAAQRTKTTGSTSITSQTQTK